MTEAAAAREVYAQCCNRWILYTDTFSFCPFCGASLKGELTPFAAELAEKLSASGHYQMTASAWMLMAKPVLERWEYDELHYYSDWDGYDDEGWKGYDEGVVLWAWEDALEEDLERELMLGAGDDQRPSHVSIRRAVEAEDGKELHGRQYSWTRSWKHWSHQRHQWRERKARQPKAAKWEHKGEQMREAILRFLDKTA